jgi:HAD superfamily 5'-nucleotidase-like hydrolase
MKTAKRDISKNLTDGVTRTFPSNLSGEGANKFSQLETLGLNVTELMKSKNIAPRHELADSDLFCNRELSLKTIQAIGFDMDFTLAQYTEEFDLLAYNGAKEKLVKNLGYPKDVLDLPYDQNTCRRGILIDKKRGNFLKMDKHKYVKMATHGLRKLSSFERQSLYRWTPIKQYSSKNYVSVDTPFSLVDACLFARLVDLKDRLQAERDLAYQSREAATDGEEEASATTAAAATAVAAAAAAAATTTTATAAANSGADEHDYFLSRTYEELWTDMRSCVDRCHKDGVIKLAVAENPSKYIVDDPNLIPMLRSIRSSGKKVFMVTNSLWDYTHVVMNYLEGKKCTPDERDLTWTSYFDVIVTFACKPAYIVDDHLALYRVKNPAGHIENLHYLPDDPAKIREILDMNNHPRMGEPLKGDENPKHVFQGGNAKHLHKLLQVSSSDRIVYVGDHMYADVLRSKRSLGWRTCLIVPELANEISSINSPATRDISRELRDLADMRGDLEGRIDEIEYFGEEFVGEGPDLETANMELVATKLAIRQKHKEYDKCYHPEWGSLLLTGFTDSRFAKQVRKGKVHHCSCSGTVFSFFSCFSFLYTVFSRFSLSYLCCFVLPCLALPLGYLDI